MSVQAKPTRSLSLTDLLIPGTILCNRYTLLRRIGEGGCAYVYLVYDRRFQQYRALKQMPRSPGLSDAEWHRQHKRMLREADIAARISNPHFVKAHHWFGAKDVFFIVYDFLPGHTLDAIRKDQHIPAICILLIGMDVCVGLEDLHRHGLVHRDVKPNNLVYVPHPEDASLWGRVVIIDPGISFDPNNARLTLVGRLVGTPAYMAPETIQAQSITPAADLYAMGITLYELATGSLPFSAQNPMQMFLSHIQEPIPPLPPQIPAPYCPETWQQLERIIHRCCAKSPNDRYPSVSALREELASLYAMLVKRAVHTANTKI